MVPPSRRHARQLAQKLGPLWCISTRQTNILSNHTSNSRETHYRENELIEKGTETTQYVAKAKIEKKSKTYQREASSIFSSSSESSRECSNPINSKNNMNDNDRNCDPLSAFLERYQEDAAELLATWTSIYRSCLYASEISEVLSVRIRMIFHKLLQYRAIAAAMQLYEQLMTLGVQLRQSDVLMMLQNLPYEHITSPGDEDSNNASDTCSTHRCKDRTKAEQIRLREKKKKEEQEAANISKARYSDAVKKLRKKNKVSNVEEESMCAPLTSQCAEQPVSCQTQESCSSLLPSSSISSSSTTAELSSSESYSNTSTMSHAMPLAHLHPTWIKNWFLYELSMGNLDWPDYNDSEEQLREEYNTKENLFEEHREEENISKESNLVQRENSMESEILDELNSTCCLSSEQEHELEINELSCAQRHAHEEVHKWQTLATVLEHLRLLQVEDYILSTVNSNKRRRNISDNTDCNGVIWVVGDVQQIKRNSSKCGKWALKIVQTSLLCSTHNTITESRANKRNDVVDSKWCNYELWESESLCGVGHVPDNIHHLLYNIVRCSNDWRVALSYLQLFSSVKQAKAENIFTMADVMLFFHHSAGAKPWVVNIPIETFIAEHILPFLQTTSENTLELQENKEVHDHHYHHYHEHYDDNHCSITFASRCAIWALWLSHLSTVKVTRPDAFLRLWQQTCQCTTAASTTSTPYTSEFVNGEELVSESTLQENMTVKTVIDHTYHNDASGRKANADYKIWSQDDQLQMITLEAIRKVQIATSQLIVEIERIWKEKHFFTFKEESTTVLSCSSSSLSLPLSNTKFDRKRDGATAKSMTIGKATITKTTESAANKSYPNVKYIPEKSEYAGSIECMPHSNTEDNSEESRCTNLSETQLLPEMYVDTFVTCTEAILSVLAITSVQQTYSPSSSELLSTTQTARNNGRSNFANSYIDNINASACIQIETFFESIIFGPFGIWAAFCKLYKITNYSQFTSVDGNVKYTNSKWHSASTNAFAERNKRHALERPYVSSVMVHFVLRLILLVCDGSKAKNVAHNNAKSQKVLLDKVRILLEMCLAAMELVTPPTTLTVEKNVDYIAWRKLTQRKMSEIKNTLIALSKPLLMLTQLLPESERVFFAALHSEVVHIITSYFKLFILCTDSVYNIHDEPEQRYLPNSYQYQPSSANANNIMRYKCNIPLCRLMQKRLVTKKAQPHSMWEEMQPSVRRVLRVCLDSTNSFGVQLRQQLTRGEVERACTLMRYHHSKSPTRAKKIYIKNECLQRRVHGSKFEALCKKAVDTLHSDATVMGSCFSKTYKSMNNNNNKAMNEPIISKYIDLHSYTHLRRALYSIVLACHSQCCATSTRFNTVENCNLEFLLDIYLSSWHKALDTKSNMSANCCKVETMRNAWLHLFQRSTLQECVQINAILVKDMRVAQNTIPLLFYLDLLHCISTKISTEQATRSGQQWNGNRKVHSERVLVKSNGDEDKCISKHAESDRQIQDNESDSIDTNIRKFNSNSSGSYRRKSSVNEVECAHDTLQRKDNKNELQTFAQRDSNNVAAIDQSYLWNEVVCILETAVHHTFCEHDRLTSLSLKEINKNKVNTAISNEIKGISVSDHTQTKYWNATYGSICEREHERTVLTACLPSLLKISMSIGKRDMGVQWLDMWRSLFTSSEQQESMWQAYYLYALHILRQRSALHLCVELYHKLKNNELQKLETEIIDHSMEHVRTDYIYVGNSVVKDELHIMERVLSKIAAEHFHWATALNVLFDVFGKMEDLEHHHNEHQEQHQHLHYSYEVQNAILTLLCRAPKNMSNSALRLHTIQANSGNWDIKADLALLHLLLKARRWSIALTQTKRALHTASVNKLVKILTSTNLLLQTTWKGETSTENKEEHELQNNEYFHKEEEECQHNNDTKRKTVAHEKNSPLNGDVDINILCWLDDMRIVELICYIDLLMNGLQACAIGGCDEEALELYDAFKVVVWFSHNAFAAVNHNTSWQKQLCSCNVNETNMKSNNSVSNSNTFDDYTSEKADVEQCSNLELEEKKSEQPEQVDQSDRENKRDDDDLCSKITQSTTKDKASLELQVHRTSHTKTNTNTDTKNTYEQLTENLFDAKGLEENDKLSVQKVCTASEELSSLELNRTSVSLSTSGMTRSVTNLLVEDKNASLIYCCEQLMHEVGRRISRARALFFRAMTKKVFSPIRSDGAKKK